jgi:LysR family transcriptional regulator, positive regulator for ilvC
MNLDDLKAFEHLAQSLHFGKSARARGMSASALTRRVQALESELGQALLLRNQREVQLTPAGVLFRKFARQQLERWEELQAELHLGSVTPTGTLDIACTVTACHTVLPKLLAHCRQRHPAITLRLLTQDAEQSRAQLQGGEIDLAVVPTEPGGAPGLAVLPLATTALVFIGPLASGVPEKKTAPKRVPKAPPEANAMPLVAPIGGLERERLDGWLSRGHVAAQIVAEVRGNEGIIAMVSLGCGIGLVPELVLASSPLRSTVRVLTELTAPPGYQVSLCARPRSLKRPVVEVFWQLAEQLVRAPGAAI